MKLKDFDFRIWDNHNKKYIDNISYSIKKYQNENKVFLPLGNVFEKVSEYFRAKDDLERAEALCDIAVFFFNAFELKFGAFSNIKKCKLSF